MFAMSMILPTLGGTSSKPLSDTLDDMSQFRLNVMVAYAFEEFLYAIHKSRLVDTFINPCLRSPDPFYTEKELHLKCALVLLLKDAHRKNPERVVIPRSVREVEHIGPALKRELEKLRSRIAEAADDPRRVAAGKASYQTFLVQGLIISAKIASQCMHIFQKHDHKIFNSVIDLVEDFFEEVNVYPEIRRDSVTRHPFGKVRTIRWFH